MGFMFKKIISYLIIVSLLLLDSASCMYEDEGNEPLLRHSRRLSSDNPQINNQPDIPEEVKEGKLLRPQGDNVDELEVEASQLPFPVNTLPLPEEEGSPVPPQGNSEPEPAPGIVVAEDEVDVDEAVRPAAPPPVAEEDEDGFPVAVEVGHRVIRQGHDDEGVHRVVAVVK